MPQRKIIHIDMDAFFASVEQRDHPELRGKPVAVGGSSLRGVVAAASYEARKFGVRSAMPSVTAKKRCPDLIFVKHRFDVYTEVSRQVRAIFAEYTPLVEPLSLDEAYLDVTENLAGVASATQIAENIRARIRAETGLTASAGVSYNKFLAKLASDHRKPDGLFVITPRMGPAFIETLPVGKFHGVGPATTEKMNRLGIHTGLDLRARSLEFLQERFGKSGQFYYWISRGVDERPVRADRIRKSVGAENTFFDDLTEFEAMREALAAHHRQALAALRNLGHPWADGDAQGEIRRFPDQLRAAARSPRRSPAARNWRRPASTCSLPSCRRRRASACSASPCRGWAMTNRRAVHRCAWNFEPDAAAFSITLACIKVIFRAHWGASYESA